MTDKPLTWVEDTVSADWIKGVHPGLDLFDAQGRISDVVRLRAYLAQRQTPVAQFKATPLYQLQLKFPEMAWLKDV